VASRAARPRPLTTSSRVLAAAGRRFARGTGARGVYDDYTKIKFKNTDGLAGRWKLLWQFVIGGIALAIYGMGEGTIAPDTSISLPFVSITTFIVQKTDSPSDVAIQRASP